MSQKGNFKGKRPSPYSNHSGRPWKERQRGGERGDRSERSDQAARGGGGGGSRDEEPRNNEEHPLGTVEGRQEIPAVFEPANFVEKGRREKKFGNRGRLYVGNLPRGMTEDELRQLFSQFGETEQIYIEKDKNFGFVRMAYRSDGERAIAALNGEEIKGREIRVRFAANSCSVKVNNLHHTVSNELLTQAFSIFGEVEFAAVMMDERGKSLGYGVIDFAKKMHAINVIEKCREGCFILTRSPIPVTVTELKRENEEGLPESQLQRTSDYNFERDSFPRMALPGSAEFEFSMRWKTLYENERKVREEIDAQLKDQRKLLEAETEQFHHHEHAALIRQQLMEHQREQARLEQRLRQHEEYIKGLSGGPPSSILSNPGGYGSLSLPPQPLLSERLSGGGGRDHTNSHHSHFIKNENVEGDPVDGAMAQFIGGTFGGMLGGQVTGGLPFLLQQHNSQFPPS